MKSLTKKFIVTPECTAKKLGSGTLEVLSTPIMTAWMENTAMELIADNLADGDTTVGIMIEVQHVKASAIGTEITCTANLISVEGRKYTFEIECSNPSMEIIGSAKHERFAVNAERFIGKL